MTVALPVTTDCAIAGAICTGDGRMLSNRLEFHVAAPNTPATGQPSITGAARVGETLTAATSGIADADGMDDATFTYRWLAGGTDIEGAVAASYTLAGDDKGQTIKVKVSFTDDAGNNETLTSRATAAVAARPNTPATGAPTIRVTAQVGETLTALTSGISDADGLTNTTFTYQWLAEYTEISGATGSSYTVTDGDVGQTIRVRVSFTDDAGNAETLTSTSTAAVVRPPLTASAQNVPQSHDRQDTFTFELRFSEEPADGFSYKTLRDDGFTITGGSVTHVRRLEPGRNIGWKITITPGSDEEVTIVLNSTSDCTAEGAICTGDRRPLSNRLEITVPGPGG